MRILPYLLGVVMVYHSVMLPDVPKKRWYKETVERALAVVAASGGTYLVFKLGIWYGDYTGHDAHYQRGWQEGYKKGYSDCQEGYRKAQADRSYFKQFVWWLLG